jgi:hypothetical protein
MPSVETAGRFFCFYFPPAQAKENNNIKIREVNVLIDIILTNRRVNVNKGIEWEKEILEMPEMSTVDMQF